ncbi:MAG: ABC transporter permease [Blastocatellales bacterium]
MQSLWQDLRYGARMLFKQPGFTLIAVLTLALGIGTATAIFSFVDAVLLRQLPYPQPERLVQLREINERGSQIAVTDPNFGDVRDRVRGFEAVAQYAAWPTTVTGASEPVRARVGTVSGAFFRTLGVQPQAGRAFAPEETKPGGNPVAVVSYGFWRRLLGGNPNFNDSRLKIDGRNYTVIGVMPPGFDFPNRTEVWIARELFPPNTSRTAHNWNVIARLGNGVTLDQARAELSALGRRLKQEYGKTLTLWISP